MSNNDSDFGLETMNLRILLESTSFNPDIQPIISSTPYPKRKLNELSELNSPSSTHSQRNISAQFHISPPQNFSQLSNTSEGFLNYAQSPNNSENYYENRLNEPIPEVSSERSKRTNRPTQKLKSPIPSSLITRKGKSKKANGYEMEKKIRRKATSTQNYLLFHVYLY